MINYNLKSKAKTLRRMNPNLSMTPRVGGVDDPVHPEIFNGRTRCSSGTAGIAAVAIALPPRDKAPFSQDYTTYTSDVTLLSQNFFEISSSLSLEGDDTSTHNILLYSGQYTIDYSLNDVHYFRNCNKSILQQCYLNKVACEGTSCDAGFMLMA